MAELPFRNLILRRLSFTAAFVAIFAGVVLAACGFYLLWSPKPDTNGALMVVGGLLLVTLSLILHVLVLLSLKTESNINRIHGETLDLQDTLRRLEPMLKTICDNSQISDSARSITNREREREALRQAIREEMYGGDWEAAQYLVDEMERRFGYKQEAQSLRQELGHVREMTIEEKIGQAIAQIEKFMTEYRWDRARQEIERLMRLFPRHERVLGLAKDLSARRAQHKQELLAEWKVAIDRNEIDHGISILTQLDQYMTPQEAVSLRESARHVFKEHLLNLGVQFGLAVTEQRWRDSLEIGLQIRQEYPNSRMAQEVGEKLETLRVRAGYVKDAEVTQRGNAAMSQRTSG